MESQASETNSLVKESCSVGYSPDSPRTPSICRGYDSADEFSLGEKCADEVRGPPICSEFDSAGDFSPRCTYSEPIEEYVPSEVKTKAEDYEPESMASLEASCQAFGERVYGRKRTLEDYKPKPFTDDEIGRMHDFFSHWIPCLRNQNINYYIVTHEACYYIYTRKLKPSIINCVENMASTLAKLFTYPEKIVAAFSIILPELLKLIIFSVILLYKYYKIMSMKCRYASMINKKSSKFCHSKKARPHLGDCSVCLSEIEEGEEGMELDGCKHEFHRHCLEKWLKGYKATCPLCRSAVLPKVVVKEYEKMQSDEEDDWIQKELALVFFNAIMDFRSCNGFSPL